MQDCWSMQVLQNLLTKRHSILIRTIDKQTYWWTNYSSSLPHVITHLEHILSSLLRETLLRSVGYLIFRSLHTWFIWNVRSESHSFQPYRESLFNNLFLLKLSQSKVLQVLRDHSQVRCPLIFLLPSSRIQACKACLCRDVPQKLMLTRAWWSPSLSPMLFFPLCYLM